jgi:hypothetical protein
MTRFLLSHWRLRVSWYGAPYLTKWQVCKLLVQLLFGLASAVTLGSKFRRTHFHILLSHLRFPQPGGQGSRIYIPQEQGAPVIPTGTGFTFCRLLGLASKSKSHYDRQSVGQSVLVSGAHLGPATNFTFALQFSSDSCGFVICNALSDEMTGL